MHVEELVKVLAAVKETSNPWTIFQLLSPNSTKV